MRLNSQVVITADRVDFSLLIVEIIMLLTAAATAIYAYKAYNHQKCRSKKQAACELAKYYAEVIIEKYTAICNVFVMSGYRDYLCKIVCFDEINDFDKQELDNLLLQKNIDSKEFFDKSHHFDPLVIFACRMARVYSVEDRRAAIEGTIVLDEENEKAIVRTAPYIHNDFMQDVTSLLNDLEWFSMNCHYGLADEELIYQSLHQVFLSTVLMLYPIICENNTNNEDKHYTNIIWLFNKWRDRLNCIKKEAFTKKQKYLKKAEAIKTKVHSGKCV